MSSQVKSQVKPHFGLTTLSALALMLCTAACRDSTTDPGDPLTLEEAEALYAGILDLTADSTRLVSANPDGGVFACPLGGRVAAAWDVREEMAGDTARIVTGVTLDPDGCVLSSEGYEFTVDGNPNVQVMATISTVGSTAVFLVEGSTTGGVDWESGRPLGDLHDRPDVQCELGGTGGGQWVRGDVRSRSGVPWQDRPVARLGLG